jgi:hypothetical protein
MGYLGKHDRIAIGAVILPKISKIEFHNTNSYSLGVAIHHCFRKLQY